MRQSPFNEFSGGGLNHAGLLSEFTSKKKKGKKSVNNSLVTW
jgi:hypothetical protein